MSNRMITVPPVNYPYYWQFDVTTYAVWVRLNRRPFGLFRNAVCSKAAELVSHHDAIDDEVLDRIEKAMDRIHTKVLDQLAAKLATHLPKGVKVKVNR